MLHLTQRLAQTQELQQICTVCGGQLGGIDPQPQAHFASKYSGCPCCGRKVGNPLDKNYQARARRYMKRNK